jgi:hypothetical protein
MTPVFVLVVLCCMDLADAFARFSRTRAFDISTPHRRRTVVAKRPFASLFMAEDLFADIAVTVRTSDFHTTSGETVVDKNGKEFTVGSVIRVCVEGLKAYQINPKGQGAYGDDKKFVPDVSDAAKKFLLLPVGLRGTVTKVYDENVISANLPIQVKFSPGTNLEEGYDPPTALLMHFMAHEVECVE